jgi:hypothetical protein
LIYKRTTAFEHGLSLDFLDHDCTPSEACPNENPRS